MAEGARGIGWRTAVRLLAAAAVVGCVLLWASRPAPSVSARPVLDIALEAPRPPKPRPKPTLSAPPALVVKRVLTVPDPFRHGDHVWDEEGVPAGPLVITVDLEAQTLSAFRGGYEIGAAVIVYGADEKPSPLGVYPILQKKADHVSNLYGAPMPYMLRLTNDGVAIHGSEVAADAATHGCIGVPTPFAKRLFAAAKLGDLVIVTRGKRLGMGQPIVAG